MDDMWMPGILAIILYNKEKLSYEEQGFKRGLDEIMKEEKEEEIARRYLHERC